MHQIISILVEATNEEQAKEEAISQAESLLEMDALDYYDEKTLTVVKADTVEGRKIIADCLKYNREQFDDAIKAINKNILGNLDELYHNGMARWAMSKVFLNEYDGIFFDGCSLIETDKDIPDVIEGLYVANMDVHR